MEAYKNIIPCTDEERRFLRNKLFDRLDLLMLVANRGKYKTYAVNGAVQHALLKLARDFNLESSIHAFLIENGHVDRKKYRVSDLRKFPGYAHILGFKDHEKLKPDELIAFEVPRG